MEMIHTWFKTFHDIFAHHIVFSTGLLMLTGYIFGRIAEKCRLPVITGYILAGLILGSSVLDMVPEKAAVHFNSITEIALSIIAVIIGAEFNLSRLRRTGGKIIAITLFQAVFAFAFVALFFICTSIPLPYILILAAIATATAPAATVVIVKELRARGEFIDYLYGVVAIDDAICVIIFSIVFAVSVPLICSGSGNMTDITLLAGLWHAFLEIMFSCILGAGGGFLLNLFVRKKTNDNEILLISLAVLFIVTAFAITLHLSLLMANMMLGASLINLSSKNKKILHALEPITPPLFALFFVLAGTEINLRIFSQGSVLLYGLIFLTSRFAGKYSGTFIGGLCVGTSKQIRNYLGLCLFPQAGVAVGLVLFVQTSPVFEGIEPFVQSTLILCVNVILLSIFLNEFIGPSISRYGITKGAELK